MYKIDRRGGRGQVQKSFTRTDPNLQTNLASLTSFTRDKGYKLRNALLEAKPK